MQRRPHWIKIKLPFGIKGEATNGGLVILTILALASMLLTYALLKPL